MSHFRTLGVIPARGGSKSVPKKNIADLCGKPLISYTIEASQASELLDTCIVSTDCPEIASVARMFNAEVPFIRPEKLATDTSDSLSVVTHALYFMENVTNSHYDAIVMLQPTTPFRPSSSIDKAITLLSKGNLDSVVSVVNVGANHPFRMYTLDSEQHLSPFVEGVSDPMMPRQCLPPVFIRSGDIYATTRSCILDQQSLIGSRSAGLVVNPDFAINIDEPLDLEIARLKSADFSSFS